MSRSPATYVVQLTQFSGVEVNAHLVLDKQPTRQDIKLKTLSNYVQQHPSGWKKRLELAELLYSMGHWQEAVQEYRQVLQRQPHLMQVRLQLGKILQLMGRQADAIAVYQSALFLSPNMATQNHLNGLIEVCRCCPQQAVRLFESAASLEPNNPAHWYALGQVHLEAESPVAALRSFDAILSRNPDDIVALSWSYDPLLAVGNFQEAQRRLEQALKLAPNDCRTLERLATHRCYQGLVWGEEGKQTRQLIRAALRLAPDSANAHQVLSLYHLHRGEWEKGVAVLLQFAQQHPQSPGGWYHYAWCLFHTGYFQGAADAILKAYRLYQNDCEIYRALCEILPAAGRLGELHQVAIQSTTPPSPHCPLSSASLVEEMLDRFPQRWSVWVSAGRVLVEGFKDLERGCRVSATGVQLQPQLADAWFRHGRVLALAGRHREAVEALNHGWQWLPQQGDYMRSVPAALWLGESYQALGDEARSRKWWEEGYQRAQAMLEFNLATAYYWQGKTLSALGDMTGAKRAYRSALSQHLPYPACEEVKEALKHL
jgi:tetratricopeptide (TPR) repeat protein